MTRIKTLARKWKALSLPTQIFIGIISGIATGLFFGDSCRILQPISTSYSMLLQVVVYPFIICTLIGSLGKLTPRASRRIFKQGWMIYTCLMLLCFCVLFILTQAFPVVTSSLQTNVTHSPSTTRLIELIIPDNLFEALANNYVPAVILFCLLFGLMLQRIKSQSALFLILETVSEACIEFWHWLLKLAPIGVFATLAYTAGTIRFAQIKNVAEYLSLFTAGILLLGFWLIPALISSLTKIRYVTLLKSLQTALIISSSMTLSVLAIPYIKDSLEKFLKAENIYDKDSSEVIDTILLVGFPLAQLGNFFIYLFAQFALTYYNKPISHLEHFLLPIATWLASIGSAHTVGSAMTFLSSWLKLPSDAQALFESLNLITEYGAVLVTVMGLVFLSFLVTYACHKKIHWNFKKIFTHIILVAIILTAFAFILRAQIPDPGIKIYNRINALSVSSDLTKGVDVIMAPPLDEETIAPMNTPSDSLFRIQKTGVLRVGYNADTRPYVYYNDKGQLVGFDVAMMYALAQNLHVKLEFIPYSWNHLTNDLLGNQFDIAIGGLYVTSQRLEYGNFTNAYLKLPMTFVVPKNKQDEFYSLSNINKTDNLRIALSNDPFLIDLVKQYLPNAELIPLDNLNALLIDVFLQQRAAGAVWDQAGAQIWALGHPGYIAVVPDGVGTPFVIAYMTQRNSPQFLSYLNYWLELKENEGFKQRAYNKWILGQVIEADEPRWSILHNVILKAF